MGISKIVIFFVILGLATCGADRCSVLEMNQAMQNCGTNMLGSLQTAGTDKKKACSGLNQFKTCLTDATDGCGNGIATTVSQTLQQYKSLQNDCTTLGYSHASSTSVVNIALLMIAAVASLVPFV